MDQLVRLRRALAVALTAISVVVIYASPAHAGTVDVLCQGTEAASFSPGLTFTVKHTNMMVDGMFPTCASSDPNVDSGTSQAHLQGDLSCLEGSASGPTEYQWNTGETSTAEITAAVAVRPAGGALITVTGTVTAGKFAGDTLYAVLAVLPDELLGCLTASGVQSTSGPRTVAFTQP